jgi:hypothetical protein
MLAVLGIAPRRAGMPALRLPAQASAARRADGPGRTRAIRERARAFGAQRSRNPPALARDVRPHRARARFQIRLDRPQVPGKVRNVASMGSERRTHHANPRGAQLGPLAPDRLRQITGRRMSKKTSGPPFAMVTNQVLDAPAWRAMSHGARSLYVALKRRYWQNKKNNGRIYLSVRQAAKELGSGRTQIIRWFRELQHYGFIVMSSPGCLGMNGKGQAPRWRLTEVSYMRGTASRGEEDMPTMDFLKWNGTPFSKHFAPTPNSGFVLSKGHSNEPRTPHPKLSPRN